MKPEYFILLSVLLISGFLTNTISGEVIGFAAHMGGEQADSSDETTAWFYAYIPGEVDSVRAAFYVSHHGIGDITREDMQQFAAGEKIALLGFFGTPVQRGFDPVSIVDEYIDSLATLTGHPELPDVPIMTFGHSNGTGFAVCWPRDRPGQCIAWVSYHPGFNHYLLYENTERIPSMVMVGTADGYFNPEYDPTGGRRGSRQDTTVYSLRQNHNAPVNIMVEGGVAHHPKDHEATWGFIFEYLRAAMRIRLAEDGTLKNINIESGWLGSHYELDAGGRQMLDIASYADYTGDKSRANWLPDREFAQLWQCYGATARLCSPPVNGVSLTPAGDSLWIGETLQLSATVSPPDAGHKNVTYSSSNTPVASVNADGLVSATGAGTAYITVTTEDGSFIDECEVVVYDTSSTIIVLESAISSFSIFPNPVNQQIEIELPDHHDASYAIFNHAGQTVLSGDIYTGAATINVSELISSIYLLLVRAGGEIYTGRIMKQ
jgi:hypothetical protein